MDTRNEIRMKLWCDAYVAMLVTAPTTSLGVANLAVEAFDVMFPPPVPSTVEGNAPPDRG